MRNLIFFFLLISFCAFSQKTPATLISENDATTYSAPFRIRNAFNDQILSNVNQRVPEFLDSADITKRIKWFLHGSHPTATTYNLTLPNGSGTIARTSDLSGWLTGTVVSDLSVIAPFSFAEHIFSFDITTTNQAVFGTYRTDIADTYGLLITHATGFSLESSNLGTTSSISGNGTNLFITFPGFSTPGDMIYRGLAGNLVSLPKGAEGTILRAGVTLPAYSTFTIPNTISALSTFVADSANVLTEITPAAGQSIRVNAGGTAWEAYTPGGGSSVLSDITAATGSNTINSGANHQIWDWDSLTSGTGMSFRSSSTGADSSTLKVVSIEKSGANANSSQTTTALNVSNTSTGTSATNVAGRFTAIGGDNNYALDIVGGVNWSNGANRSTWTQTHTGSQPGINLETNRNAAAVQFGIQNTNSGTSAETRFRLAGAAQTGWLAMAGANNTSAYGEGYRMALWNSANAGIIFGTNNTGRAVFTNDNKFVFGATSITSGSVLADFQSTTLGVLVPRVTNTAAISTPVNGMVAYDSDTNEFIFRQNGSWTGLGIGGSVGSTDNAILRADVGSGVVQSSLLSINDSGGLVSSDTTFTVTLSNGSEIGLDGGLKNIVISGTSATLDNTHVGKNVKCTSDSETDLTVSSTIVLEKVMTITQRGNGTVNLLAGSNVVINGKTSTTGQWDMIWLYLIEKSGGISYFIGR